VGPQYSELSSKGENMFTIDPAIDMIQTGKKQFVSTFVTNKNVADALNSFVDAQSEYTKRALKISSDTATVLTQEAIKASQDVSKFDYSKFGEGIMKAYSEINKVSK
jgi:predicted phage gp36 major capsid-like protein